MDYHSLPRRQLQTLCKQHGIPANRTNVEMANCLSALLNRKPELEAGANMEIDASEATPRSALRKEYNGDHEASLLREKVNCPYLDTPSNSVDRQQENGSEETKNNDFGDQSMPRTCMMDPLVTQSRLKKGSVSFSETVEVKVMQSYENPVVDMPSLSNVKKTRTSTRLSVGGTPTEAKPVGRRSSVLKSDISESETVSQKVANVTRSSARKGSMCSSEEIKAEKTTSISVSRRRNSNVSLISNASTKVEVEDTVGRSRPPRTPRAALKKNNGLGNVLSEISAVDDSNVFVTPAITSVKKSNPSTSGTLEKKHLDSAFKRVDKSENELSSTSADIFETPHNFDMADSGLKCRVTRGSIGRITRSASKSLTSGQTSNRIESIPITRRNTKKERLASDTPGARDGSGCSTRKTVAGMPCLSKDFEGLTLSDDIQPSSESSNISLSVIKVTDPNDGQIESNVVAENILSMDACVDNLSQALSLPSENTIKEHSVDIPSLHTLENSSDNSNAPVCIASSIEECQDESFSKGDLLDVDDGGTLEKSESSNVDEFIRGTLVSLVENTVLNSDFQKNADGYNGTEKNHIQLTLRKSYSPMYSESCNSELQSDASEVYATYCDNDVQSKMLNEENAKDNGLSEAQSEEVCIDDAIFCAKTQTSSFSDKIIALSAENNGLVNSNENLTLENVDVGGSDTVLDLPIFCNDISPSKSPKTNFLNEYEDQDSKFCPEESIEVMEPLDVCDGLDATHSVIEYNDIMDSSFKHCSRTEDEGTIEDTESLDETQSAENVSTKMEHLQEPERLEETLSAVDLNEDVNPLGESAYIVLTSDVSKESVEECNAEVEACITIDGSEDIESESVNLIQNAVHDYTFSLQQNKSLQYTHVEENSNICIMGSLVSRNGAAAGSPKFANAPENAIADINVIVQKFADLSTSVGEEVVEISSGIDQTDVSLVEEVDSIGIDMIDGEVMGGHHNIIAETNAFSENESKYIEEPLVVYMEVGSEDDAQLLEAVNVCAIQLSKEAQPIPSNATIVQNQSELMQSPTKVDWIESSVIADKIMTVLHSTTEEVNAFSEKEVMSTAELLVVGVKIGSENDAQLLEAENMDALQSCEEAKLNPSNTMIAESELASMSLRKLKELVKKKDKTKSKVSESVVVVETTEVLVTDIAQSKTSDKEKPNEKILSVTPLSGVKKPWKLSSKLVNNATLSHSNDSPSSAGKRSALKSLPSNVRQASSGGGTPTGKLGSLANGVGKVQSPALDHSDAGTENRLVMTPSRLALNSCQKINHSVRSLHR